MTDVIFFKRRPKAKVKVEGRNNWYQQKVTKKTHVQYYYSLFGSKVIAKVKLLFKSMLNIKVKDNRKVLN